MGGLSAKQIYDEQPHSKMKVSNYILRKVRCANAKLRRCVNQIHVANIHLLKYTLTKNTFWKHTLTKSTL